MTPSVHVHLLPALVEPAQMSGGVVVVIDVLRASTTIIHALAAGTDAVIPCQEVEEARSSAANLLNAATLLGGERGGARIPGFDLDNSPLNYTSAAVGGKIVVFTTTNGTRAMRRADQAHRILIGAPVNRQAILRLLRAEMRPMHLLCAGTDGGVSAEDVLFAGAIARGLWDAGAPESVDDQTRLALALFDTIGIDAARTLECLRHSRGGWNLVELGFEADIERSAQWDLFDVVPELDQPSGRITAAAGG